MYNINRFCILGKVANLVYTLYMVKIEICKNIIDKAVEERVFPGCVIGYIEDGTKFFVRSGKYTYDSGASQMERDSVFDMASITKSIPTSCLLVRLIGANKVHLDDKVSKFIPEIANRYRDDILIRHLLTYTLDFEIQLSKLKEQKPEEILESIFKADLRVKPGENFRYINATAVLAGLVVERLEGRKLDELADEFFFKPLKMNKTTFHPEIYNKKDVVPTEIDAWRSGVVQAVVHDESTYTMAKKFVVGSAGLFSTAPDLLNFVEMLLNHGEYNHIKYLENDLIKEFYKNQIDNIGESVGLGWEYNQPRYMGKYANEIFGKTGFTGCAVMINMKKKRGLVMLTNYTYPKRKADAKLINNVRREIADLIFG